MNIDTDNSTATTADSSYTNTVATLRLGSPDLEPTFTPDCNSSVSSSTTTTNTTATTTNTTTTSTAYWNTSHEHIPPFIAPSRPSTISATLRGIGTRLRHGCDRLISGGYNQQNNDSTVDINVDLDHNDQERIDDSNTSRVPSNEDHLIEAQHSLSSLSFFFRIAKRSFYIVKVVTAILLVLALIACIIMMLVPNSPLHHVVPAVLHWVSSIPRGWGALALLLSYAAGLLIFLPGTPFDLAGGFMFGFWWGTLVSTAGATLGACIAFGLGRTIARRWAARLSARRRRLSALDRAVSSKGFKLVFLTRCSPLLPFALLNYFFGVTAVPWYTYAGATYLGVFPGTAVYCYFGTLLHDVGDIFTDATGHGSQIAVLVTTGVLTVAALVLITWITRRTLMKELQAQEEEEEEEGEEIDQDDQNNNNNNENNDSNNIDENNNNNNEEEKEQKESVSFKDNEKNNIDDYYYDDYNNNTTPSNNHDNYENHFDSNFQKSKPNSEHKTQGTEMNVYVEYGKP